MSFRKSEKHHLGRFFFLSTISAPLFSVPKAPNVDYNNTKAIFYVDGRRLKLEKFGKALKNREEQIIETQDKPQCLVAAKATLTLTIPGCN